LKNEPERYIFPHKPTPSELMKTWDQRRRELVEWNSGSAALVFRETTAQLSDFWASLCGSAGMKGFLDRFPEVPVQAAQDVLRLAGVRFCWWPEDPAKQEAARRRADPRFEVAESTPGVRGGRLCFIGTSLYFEILFDNLDRVEDSGGATLDDLSQWYHQFPKHAATRAVMIAADLFSEGLVPDADFLGQRCPSASRRPSEKERP
jgi:hypothetical protein